METQTWAADARRGVDRALGEGGKPARVVVVPVGKDDSLRQRLDAERGGVPRERGTGARVEQKAASARVDEQRKTVFGDAAFSPRSSGVMARIIPHRRRRRKPGFAREGTSLSPTAPGFAAGLAFW